ncbi:glucose ABC transporter membrane protein [Hydrogenispora ethanolica]|uniref:Glucose ABC transporter membrane protein n=1 Tax=Hydrogenispora ethanolica TaxID=1082276 RepID=A0A4R1R8T0_HYDET|nr:carbohydrate ABC transporter permease [Hydrogenispora ethanolica]TCL62071.1 glucose ABC transporter membrane protein [Hydrogenispora ethanolica]
MAQVNANYSSGNSAATRQGSALGTVAVYAALIVAAAMIIIPLLLMISSAFKNESEIFDYPVKLIPEHFIWSNFQQLLKTFPVYIYNSVKVTVLITVVQVVTATTGAYAFAKLRWKGRDALFMIYIASIMVPQQVMIIPQFIMVRNMGLYDTHLALILLGSFTAFGTFLVKQYFMTIPDSLLEAARIDGANDFLIFGKIMLPLAKPVIAAQIIFSFRYFWNDFFTPMIYLSKDYLKTIPLGMSDFVTQYTVYYGPQMAACVISVIPVIMIFLAAQKYFVQGIAAGGVKG